MTLNPLTEGQSCGKWGEEFSISGEQRKQEVCPGPVRETGYRHHFAIPPIRGWYDPRSQQNWTVGFLQAADEARQGLRSCMALSLGVNEGFDVIEYQQGPGMLPSLEDRLLQLC